MDTYEKKYNEALEKAKNIYKEGVGMDVIQYLFPELRESEDERIRKSLLAYIKGESKRLDTKKWIAYLEKQKETLHISETCKENADSFTDEDEDRTINGCLLAANAERRCKRASEELLEELGLADYTKLFYEQGVEKGKKEREKQKEQKPAEWSDYKDKVNVPYCSSEPEWSEEDEKMRDRIIYVLQKDITYTPPTRPNSCTGSGNAFYTHQTEIDWLKSLRPSWKPSEGHLSALLAIFNDPNNIGSQTCQLFLTDLYEQLKKL